MKYETVLLTIRNILENELIEKKGLSITYELDKASHKKLDEEIFIQIHGHLNGFDHQDIFEIELDGLLVKFIQKELDD
jgi:hypothetical protein